MGRERGGRGVGGGVRKGGKEGKEERKWVGRRNGIEEEAREGVKRRERKRRDREREREKRK